MQKEQCKNGSKEKLSLETKGGPKNPFPGFSEGKEVGTKNAHQEGKRINKLTITTVSPATKGPALCIRSGLGTEVSQVEGSEDSPARPSADFHYICRSTLQNSCCEIAPAHTSFALTLLGRLFAESCMRLHNCIADSPRNGGSAKFLARGVILIGMNNQCLPLRSSGSSFMNR